MKCRLNVATMTSLCEAQALCDLGLVHRDRCAQGVSDPWKALTSAANVGFPQVPLPGPETHSFPLLTGCAGHSPWRRAGLPPSLRDNLACSSGCSISSDSKVLELELELKLQSAEAYDGVPLAPLDEETETQRE